jgi:G:T-mismatch repair DNA endonuclease (very short patch repair protein)
MLGIPNDSEHRQVRIKIGKSRYSVDGFDPDKNIVYEFYGDLWHGNPNIYRPDDFCMATKKTFGEMFSRTMEKEEKLKKAGYSIVSIWECDYRKLYEK